MKSHPDQAAATRPGSGSAGQGCDGAGAQVGDRADVEDHARDDLAQRARIPGSGDAMPDPVGGQQIERRTLRVRAAKLTCVRYRAEDAAVGLCSVRPRTSSTQG